MASETVDADAILSSTDLASGTKTRLKSMTEGLEDFSQLLRTGNRQRREKEDHRVAELKSDIAAAERTIIVESEKRVEMGRALQSWAETQVVAIRTRLESLISAARQDMDAKFAALHTRIDSLEATFHEDRERVMADVRKRNEELVEALKEFNAAFEIERAARLEREQKIRDRIAKLEHESVYRFDEERQVREQVYIGAKRRLEDAVIARTKADEKFQTSVWEEVAAIKNALAAEESARIAEDNEIAETLNRYVQKLQASLAMMLSEDTTTA